MSLDLLSLVEVREGRFGNGVYAAVDFVPGQLVLRGWGPLSPKRTQHSMQVDRDRHVDIEPPIRYINHSCDPNCGIYLPRGAHAVEIHALRPIAAGDELSMDYATFEYEIDFMPCECLCGAATCRGRITGYKDLPDHVVAGYGKFVAEYLSQYEPAAAPSR